VEQALEDAAYVAVGLAVLEFQRAQVRRRALMGQLGRLGGLLAASGTPRGDSPAAEQNAAPNEAESSVS
jgi:hypothetical protein